MDALYKNRFGELVPCKVLSCAIVGNMVLIEINGVRGYCSGELINEGF